MRPAPALRLGCAAGYVDEVVVVLRGAPGACRDALGEQVALQASEADAHGDLGAVDELAAQLLPGEVAGDVAGAAEVLGTAPRTLMVTLAELREAGYGR